MDTKTLKVKTGEHFTIDIEEMPSAGYISKVKIDSTKMNLHSRVMPNNSISDTINEKDIPIGGKMDVRYTFSTKQPGEFEINIRLLQPWVGETEDDKVWVYKVISTDE